MGLIGLIGLISLIGLIGPISPAHPSYFSPLSHSSYQNEKTTTIYLAFFNKMVYICDRWVKLPVLTLFV
jgi:hypothetical protein